MAGQVVQFTPMRTNADRLFTNKNFCVLVSNIPPGYEDTVKMMIGPTTRCGESVSYEFDEAQQTAVVTFTDKTGGI